MELTATEAQSQVAALASLSHMIYKDIYGCKPGLGEGAEKCTPTFCTPTVAQKPSIFSVGGLSVSLSHLSLSSSKEKSYLLNNSCILLPPHNWESSLWMLAHQTKTLLRISLLLYLHGTQHFPFTSLNRRRESTSKLLKKKKTTTTLSTPNVFNG